MSTILADDPVAYYTFDNVTGATVPDVTGNGHNGTASGGYTAGTEAATAIIGGSSMEFDGASGKVLLSGTFGGDTKTDGVNYDWAAATIEAWVKVDTLSPTFQDILSPTNTTFCHFHVANVSDPSLPGEITLCWYGNGVSHGFVTGDAINVSEWAHVAITQKSDGTAATYINGVQVDSRVGDTFDYLSAATDVQIGAGYLGGRFLDGMIDELAIYNKALTSQEITAHYTAGTTAVPEPSAAMLLIGGFAFLLTRRIRNQKA